MQHRSLHLARLFTGLLLAAWPAAVFAGPGFDLAAAIRAAQPGSTVEVPPGRYDGPVLLDKPITLAAQPGGEVILDAHGRGDVVRITAAGATLRGFVIRNSGDDIERENTGVWVLAPHVTVQDNILSDVLFGIYAKQADGSVFRNNTISGKALDIARRGDGIRLWYSPNCLVEGNHVHDVRDVVIWFSHDVRVEHNRVARGRYGLHFMYCNDNTISDNTLEDNSVGTYLMFSRNLRLYRNTFARNRGSSGYGIGLKDMDEIVAEDNQFVGNRIGIYLDNSPQAIGAHNHFTRNLVAYNDIGIDFLPDDKRNVFVENTFQENQEQAAVIGSGRFEGNIFALEGRGNFWSDYKGYDRGGDGIGDVPYRSDSFFENLMDREPRLRFFLYSPAQQALELASRAFPAVKPQPKFSDPHPLMSPVPLHITVEASAFSWPLAGTGAALLGAASAMIALLRLFYTRQRTLALPIGQGAVPGLIEADAPAEPQAAAPARRAMRATGPVLRVQGLTKRFGSFTAVDDLSFELAAGQALALWGTNGAGKTTAIRCVLGLVRYQGTIAIAGEDLRRQGKAARCRVGYIPQEPGFQADLGVLEVLRFYARLKGAPLQRCEQLLQEVGLAGHEGKRVGALSGGMRKRLALAASLLSDPPLLILDEVTANLDSAARESFLTLLAQLKRGGKTILFTSHRLDEVQTLADRVLVLRNGRLAHECLAHDLPCVLGLEYQVKLFITPRLVQRAAEILREGGFRVTPHEQGVSVQVEPDRKAAPVYLLAEHRILVENLEIQAPDPERSQHERH